MTARLPLRLGSSDARGDDVTHWQNWAKQWAKAYADIMGPVDGYYGQSDAAFTREMQRRLGLPQTGEFDEITAARVGYAGITAAPRRPIWIYTAPGSGADWWVGPAFELGEWCKKVLHLNHQPIGYAKGGYLGLMAGRPICPTSTSSRPWPPSWPGCYMPTPTSRRRWPLAAATARPRSRSSCGSPDTASPQTASRTHSRNCSATAANSS